MAFLIHSNLDFSIKVLWKLLWNLNSSKKLKAKSRTVGKNHLMKKVPNDFKCNITRCSTLQFRIIQKHFSTLYNSLKHDTTASCVTILVLCRRIFRIFLPFSVCIYIYVYICVYVPIYMCVLTSGIYQCIYFLYFFRLK